jgi:predicted phosphodiesterase
MRLLIISDIHANLSALEAVLEDADGYDAAWCLGDLVGYGPDPNECVERVRALPDLLCLIGNHDQAALSMIPIERFNQDAGAIASWTNRMLTEENKAFLTSLPSKASYGNFTLAHGSPYKPVWEYILDPVTADRSFESFDTDYCLVGHSHLPLIFHRQSENEFALPKPVQWGELMQLSPRMILNPGSVGQPRDRDPRASYSLLDTEEETWEMRRVDYNVSEVQVRILEAGLPERQALRLRDGW